MGIAEAGRPESRLDGVVSTEMPMDIHFEIDAQPMTPEEVAKYERLEASVFAVACWIMERECDEREPHDMIWSGGAVPEPWGEAWQLYEEDARNLVELVLRANAQVNAPLAPEK